MNRLRNSTIVTVLLLILVSGYASTNTLTFPVDDTFVYRNLTTNNYSSKLFITLRSDASKFERRGMIKFDLTGVPGSIIDAELFLYSTTQTGDVNAVAIDDNSWDVNTVTWETMPAFGAIIDTVTPTASSWFSLSLSNHVTDAFVYSIGLTTPQNEAKKLSSTEGANPPYLLITTDYTFPPPTALFKENPHTELQATPNINYFSSISDTNKLTTTNELTFTKTAGPAWLNVSTQGDLRGRPTFDDLSQNTFTIEASDGLNAYTGTLSIVVTNLPAAFTEATITEADAYVDNPYSSTLFDNVNDPENDIPTFEKLSGPAWLTVVTNGVISGTPAFTDLGQNTFTVRTTDLGGSDTATILIDVVEGTPPQNDERPNILIIEVDDLSYHFISNFDPDAPSTPHIDSLAQNGVTFRNAIAPAMMCGPSRNCFISGLYPHNIGMYRNGQLSNLQRRVWTFPAAMRRSGYYSAYVGKSHIKPYSGSDEGLKGEMGFDYAPNCMGRGVLGNQSPDDVNWYFDTLREINPIYVDTFLQKESHSTLPEDIYLDGFFTRTTLDFIKDYKEDKPFLMWLNYSVPHGPNDVADEYHVHNTADMRGGTMPTYYDPYTNPSIFTNLDFNTAKSLDSILTTQAGHAANVGFLDHQVGRIKEVLAANNMLENTIIFFFSDQGMWMGEHFKIAKGTIFHPVTNPSFIASWPKGFLQNIAITNVVEVQDMIPTMLDIAGASDADKAARPHHKNLLPLLTGAGTYERQVGFNEIEEYIVAISNQYHYIKGTGGHLLFDNIQDPSNLTNIVNDLPEVAASLSTSIDNWLAATSPYYGPDGLDKDAFMLTEAPLTPNVFIQGAPFSTEDASGLRFKRFSNPDTIGPEAKTTTGVKLTLFTKSEYAWLTFDYNPGDFNQGSTFGHYQNGQFIEELTVHSTQTTARLELKSQQYPGTLVRYDIVLPSLANPILSRIELDEGLDLESHDLTLPGHIGFIGGGNTHGIGQGSASAKSYPYQVAKQLNINLQNLGVANQPINPDVAAGLSQYEPMDYLWILAGYENYWNEGHDLQTITNSYNALLQNALAQQPNAQIFCCTPTYTDNTPNPVSGLTISQVREAIQTFVSGRIANGDLNLHLVDGNTLSDATYISTDASFTDDGASRYATNVVNVLAPFIAYQHWADAIGWPDPNTAGMNQDPDKDGLANFVEYALKRSPIVPDTDGIFTLTPTTGGGIDARFTLGLGSEKINYTVLLSNDLLAGWDAITPISITGAEDETVTLPLGSYGASLFMKLEIRLPMFP